MTALGMLLGAYLLGAIPAGYLLFQTLKKTDIRMQGSSNTGATNVLRTAGWRAAVPVLLFDIGKGVLPVLLAHSWFENPWIAPSAGFAAILGHCFPVYIGFRGGKGVATTVGAFAALSPMPLLFILSVFLLVVALTRTVSLGSLAAVASYPVFAAVLGAGPQIALVGVFVFVLVTIQHRANIRRLLDGNERKLGGKSR
jgi:acyl phosphate:glycerol-3-phosphate acyltransferase